MEEKIAPAQPVSSNQTPEQLNRQRRTIFGIIAGATLFLVILIGSLVILLSPGTDEQYVARIRDVFIIIMALESLLIGAVLVILIIQVARLTNLLKNEIKPILDSTNETVSTLRGTTNFLSDHLVEPVFKLNEYLAGFQRLFELVKPGKKK